MRWIGGGLGCFSRYYKITHILSAHACIASTDMVYSKALERDVTTSAMVKATTAMVKAILRLKTLAFIPS